MVYFLIRVSGKVRNPGRKNYHEQRLGGRAWAHERKGQVQRKRRSHVGVVTPYGDLSADLGRMADHARAFFCAGGRGRAGADGVGAGQRQSSLILKLAVEMVELTRVERATPCLQSRCSTN